MSARHQLGSRDRARRDPRGQASVHIWRDAFRRLCVTVEGTPPTSTCAPPASSRSPRSADFISFLGLNDKEALLIRDAGPPGHGEPAGAGGGTHPRLLRPQDHLSIYEIEDAHGAARWEVETDRGYRVFDIRDREDVKVIERQARPPPGRRRQPLRGRGRPRTRRTQPAAARPRDLRRRSRVQGLGSRRRPFRLFSLRPFPVPYALYPTPYLTSTHT